MTGDLLGDRPPADLVAPLLDWYRANARPLPWRADATPYHVWISEVMLQQTRIEAVRPYYARFVEAAPTIADLAALPDDRLMKLWEGLGYYSRARNLKRAAICLLEQYGGEMPTTYKELLALPGIGAYTAGAIASIAYGLPCPAVDGNVLRVYTRLTADEGNVLLPATKDRVQKALFSVYAGASDPGALTQALMELGEVICLPGKKPRCASCPLASLCRAREAGRVEEIPYRCAPKTKKEEHRLVLLLCDAEGRYALCRRPSEGLLAGLWELPAIPLPEPMLGEEELDARARAFCQAHGLHSGESVAAPQARHVVTHLIWHMEGRYLNVVQSARTDPALVFVSPEDMRGTYALPSAFRAYTRVIYGQK